MSSIGTILVKITVSQANKPTMTHTARYYSVKEAMDLAQNVFPEATAISCINLGEQA